MNPAFPVVLQGEQPILRLCKDWSLVAGMSVNLQGKPVVVPLSVGPTGLLGPTSTGTGSVQTSSTGTGFTVLGTANVGRVIVFNNTGTGLNMQVGGSGALIPVFNNSSQSFTVTNLDQLAVQRTDESTVQLAVPYLWEA